MRWMRCIRPWQAHSAWNTGFPVGKLALFLVPSLLLGLMLRKPVIRFNDWVIRNLENTKVM